MRNIFVALTALLITILVQAGDTSATFKSPALIVDKTTNQLNVEKFNTVFDTLFEKQKVDTNAFASVYPVRVQFCGTFQTGVMSCGARDLLGTYDSADIVANIDNQVYNYGCVPAGGSGKMYCNKAGTMGQSLGGYSTIWWATTYLNTSYVSTIYIFMLN